MQVKANAGCAARAHVTRESAIRAHAHRLPLAVIVFLIALFVASVAYAADWYSVLYRSELDNSEQYIVSADDRWQAAAIICGRNKSYIDSLDDETRRKLSTNGGAFQTLAESLSDDWPAWNDESLADSLAGTFGGDELGSLWYRMTAVYLDMSTFPYMRFNPDGLSHVTVAQWQETCPTHIFAANIDPTLRGAANEALNIITDGGSVGGGTAQDVMTFDLSNYFLQLSGSTSGSQYTTINGVTYILWRNDVGPTGSQQYFPSGNVVTFTGLSTCFDIDTYKHILVFVYPSPYYLNYRIIALQDDYTITEGTNSLRIDTSKSYQMKVVNRSSSVDISHLGITSLPFNVTINVPSAHASTYNDGGWTENYGMLAALNGSTGGGGGGDDEPNPWPTPVPPEQPNVPEPPDVNPPPIGGPVFPTDPPEDPTITPEPEPTGTDYTIYFRAIIRQINQVMVQMSNHCKHIRDQISTSANAIISNLHTYIEDLQESIDSNFSALNDYLEDLTKWYEDFTQDIVDDIQDEFSTVESILRQILRKIGVSRGTPKEVEKEVDDDFNFLEWLINFITSKLAGVIDEFVGDVGSLIEGVKDKFPFSIPWDIMGMLALLDGVRATPRFEITLPAVSGWWQQTTFVIDLSPFDSVASAVRMMINAWWVLVLALKTNWMLMIMGDSTSLGERIANRISGGGD